MQAEPTLDSSAESTDERYDPPSLRIIGSMLELTLGPHDPHPAPLGTHGLQLSR